MKIRSGFVSNSSSSSFVCELCGATESGWDAMAEELGFLECENEHIICEDEAYGNEEERQYVDYDGNVIDEDNDLYDGHYLKEEFCPICCFDVLSNTDAMKYLKQKYNIAEKEVLDDVKTKNKRRQRIYEKDYVNYVYDKFNITEVSLLETIKNEFKTYKEFFDSIRYVNISYR